MVLRQKSPKPKPKPTIDYPPVPRKKWVPPDQRPKKPREPAYVKPAGMTQKLAISSLNKVWHSFKIYDTTAILTGTVSQTHKRFRPKTNGFQGPCNCVIAIAFSQLYEMSQWTTTYIDKILEIGDDHYLKSVQKLEDKTRTNILVSEVFNTFYMKDIKIQMLIEPKQTGDLFKRAGQSLRPNLHDFLKTFFAKYKAAVLVTQRKQFGIWSVGGAHYLFDPNERDERGERWRDTPGKGVATITRVATPSKLFERIILVLNEKDNSPFVVYPCSILRTSKVDTKPPENVDEVLAKLKQPVVPSATKLQKAPPPPPKVEEPPPQIPAEEVEAAAETEEYSPEAAEVVKKEISAARIPKVPVKAASVTYFRELIPAQLGILRATVHMLDPKFGKYAGAQSVSIAVMALTTLRLYKTKTWVPKILDNILNVSTLFHRDMTKNLRNDEVVELCHIPEKITLEKKNFAPEIDEFAVIGKLRSTVDDVLDLLPALQEFFKNNDTCVICGPNILAVWQEDGNYYMFDPNERDNKGLVIIKRMKVGSQEKVVNYTPGTACVTWYKDLKDLADVYINNVDRSRRNEQFWLSRVLINDFSSLPDNWYNFTGTD